MKNVFKKITKVSIYLLVFLLPIFWLPFSFEAYEFNKQYLLLFLTLLASLAWLVHQIVIKKEVRFQQTPLDLFVLAFLFVACLSGIFSVDKTSSIFGFYGRFSDGLIALLSFGLFYFLITNNVDFKEKEALISFEGLLKAFFGSIFLVVLISFASLFGIWPKINEILEVTTKRFSLPPIMLRRYFNPLSGSPEGLAVFLSIVLIMLTVILLLRNIRKREKIFYGFLLLAIFSLLLLIDSNRAWVVLIGSLSFFVGFALWTRMFRQDVNKLLLPILLLIAAFFFLSPNIPKIFLEPMLARIDFQGLPREVILDQKNSWQITSNTLTGHWKNTILGSGIGTFHYDFVKFKNPDFNQNRFWQMRFDRPTAHFAETLATMGVLGFLSFLGILIVFLLISWFFLEKLKKMSLTFEQNSRSYQFFLLISFIALLISQFVYYQNIALGFLFWFILGLSVISWQKPVKERKVSFENFPELSLIFNLLLILIILAAGTVYFFSIKFYLADTAYLKGVQTTDKTEKVNLLERAVNLNPDQPQYKITLARTYLDQALSEMAKPPDQQSQVLLSRQVHRAITYAKEGTIGTVDVKGATKIAPNWVSAWEALGMIYRDIRTVAEGAREWGIKAFERAIELEPTNPVLLTEVGKLYLEGGEIQTAKEKFEKAKSLKEDFVDAQLQLAFVYEGENNTDKAIKILEKLSQDFPSNTEVLFQLGRLYYNQNKIEKATGLLKRVIFLFPDHSNAHYVLALIYQKQGKRDLAIAEFEKVLELNPGNEDVIQKLKELKGE